MKKVGIVFLIVGLIVTLFTGLNFVTSKKVVDIGALEIRADENHSLSWSPIIGVIMTTIGVGMYLLSSKKSRIV